MILEIIIFLLTTLIGYYIYCYKQIHNHFKQIGVKYVPGVPIFGNMFKSTFLKRHSIYDFDDVYTAFPDEKYVGLIELTAPIILIRDPDIIKSITVKDFDHFVDHKEFLSAETDPLFAFSLFAMKGDKWRDMRATLSPAFTASKMKYMMPFILDITNNIVEYLQEHQSENIDVDDLVRRYTNDVIASAGFGLQVNSLKDRENDFYKIGSTIFDFNIKQRIIAVLVTQFPEFAKKIGARLFPEKTYNFFRDIVSSTMERRKKEKVERPDMIQLLMDAPKEWTPDELTSQVFLFFAAGFETSASALAMAIHELALHPELQEKLYQEIRKFKEQKELTFDSLSELKYLDCVINESLRKWSPAIALDRLCVKSYELPPPSEGGRPHTLKPGDVVYNAVNCIHMDAKYFPEPEKYDPDRFSDENKHNIQPFTFMPFGSGPRICIGLRFAMMELKVLLYQIVLNFKILKTEKTSDPITLKPHAFNIRAAGGTWVKFEQRE